MALLDLQGMEGAPQTGGGSSAGSCKCCQSTLSVTLCGGSSGLSAAACH